MLRSASLPKFLLSVLVLGALSACIARGGRLPKLEGKDFTAPPTPQALTFDTVYRENGKSKEGRAKDAAKVIEDALVETGMFASVASDASKGPLHLSFEFEESYSEGLSFLSSFVCGFTLGLFPAWGTVHLSLQAVSYEGGIERGRVRVEDDVRWVMEILLLPATPFIWPPKVAKGIGRNMFLNALHDSALGLTGAASSSVPQHAR